MSVFHEVIPRTLHVHAQKCVQLSTFVCTCSWDEWVVEPRILKWNEANLQKQKELQMLHPE